MMWSDLLRLACEGLMQHKLRTLLTLIGVTLGALLLFCSLSGGLGVIETVNQRLGGGQRLLEVFVQSGFKLNPVTAEKAREAGFTQDMTDERRVRLARATGVGGRQQVNLSLDSAEEFKTISHVNFVWADITVNSTVHSAALDHWMHSSIKAIPTKANYTPLLIAGRHLRPGKQEVMVNELYLYGNGVQSDKQLADVIDSEVRFGSRNVQAERLSRAIQAIVGFQAPVNLAEMRQKLKSESDKTKNLSLPFKIVGVYRFPDNEEIRENPGLMDARRNMLMSYGEAVELWKAVHPPNQRVNVRVIADKPEHVLPIENEISAMGYQTRSLSELGLQIRSAVLLITSVITAIAAAALLISAIGITNTMIMNVLERRREIAILKSIGAKDSDVNRMFLLEGALLGVIGGLLGLALGYVLSQMTADYIRDFLERRLNEPMGDRIFSYPMWLLIGTPVLATIVTTIATFIPARRAAKVDPVTTLRAL